MVSRRSGFLGGLLLWFAVLGGAGAWAVHEVAAWSTDELVCDSGHDRLVATPLPVVLLLMWTVPLVVALAAAVAAVLSWRRTSGTAPGPACETGGNGEWRALGRAHLMAVVAVWANVIFVAIIAAGGAATLVLPTC